MTRLDPTSRLSPTTRRRVGRLVGEGRWGALLYLFPVVWAAMIAVPMIFLVMGSLRTRGEYLLDPVAVPTVPQFENYVTAWEDADLAGAFLNNLIVTVLAVGGIAVLGSLAAYGVVRWRGRGSGFWYGFFALGLIVPFQLGLPALYKLWVQAGLVDSLLGVILVHIGVNLPLAIFLYAGFLLGVPIELEESARVDGASSFRVFRSIVFPLLGPVHATVVILTAIGVWNDLLISVFFLQSKDNLTLARATLTFMSTYNSNTPVVYAAAVLVVVPILLLFVILQRFFVSGLTQGALKG
jgi:raffinose/stachyose/melibiose transport system permease protein